MLSRRHLLSTTALGGVAVVLAACGTAGTSGSGGAVTAPATTVDDALNFLSGIASQVQTLVPSLTGLPSGVQSTVSKIVGGVASGASALSGVVGQVTSAPVNAIVGAPQAIITALGGAGVSVPSWLTALSSDVQTLAPVIGSALNIALALGAFAAPPPVVDPATANATFRHLMSIRA